MKNFVNAIKETIFYNRFIDKLYVSTETPGIIWFSVKKPYTKRDEVIMNSDLADFIENDFNLFDVSCAFIETSKGKYFFNLIEVY